RYARGHHRYDRADRRARVLLPADVIRRAARRRGPRGHRDALRGPRVPLRGGGGTALPAGRAAGEPDDAARGLAGRGADAGRGAGGDRRLVLRLTAPFGVAAVRGGRRSGWPPFGVAAVRGGRRPGWPPSGVAPGRGPDLAVAPQNA